MLATVAVDVPMLRNTASLLPDWCVLRSFVARRARVFAKVLRAAALKMQRKELSNGQHYPETFSQRFAVKRLAPFPAKFLSPWVMAHEPLLQLSHLRAAVAAADAAVAAADAAVAAADAAVAAPARGVDIVVAYIPVALDLDAADCVDALAPLNSQELSHHQQSTADAAG